MPVKLTETAPEPSGAPQPHPDTFRVLDGEERTEVLRFMMEATKAEEGSSSPSPSSAGGDA